jgi:osmotically-inducible protein OsmY
VALTFGAGPLEGCILAVGAAGAGGGYQLTAERSFGDEVKDAGLAAAIGQSWKTFNPQLSEDLSATVYQGDVLVTGTVPSEDWRAEGIKRAWQIDGVKQVYDEIKVGPDESLTQNLSDDTISNKLRAQLIGDGDVKSINYFVTTVKGTVYLMGSARSQQELDRVVDHARNISDVRNVVSHVHIRTGEARKPEAPSAPAQANAAPAPAAAAPPAPAGGGNPGTGVSLPPPKQTIEETPLQ